MNSPFSTLLSVTLVFAASAEATLIAAESAASPASPNFEAADQAIGRFRIAPGFRIETRAVEPQLKNVVAFTFDEKGNVYTAETGRYRSSTLDIRDFMRMYEDDLKVRTVEERATMIQRRQESIGRSLAGESETIRFLQDANGDGRMEVSKVFADGFNGVLDGIASGVLARRGEVWLANIPDLVKLLDRNGDGVADSREVVHHGFGVRFSLTGHDLHGLILGPDGRIYFTVGDRGASITTRDGKTFAYPDEGVCFRMNQDGSNLEVFATGLRNPQELAFDQHGNLFTGDNDCDHGDMERWVHIVEGSDTGWRISYQFSEQNPGGAWLSERIWQPDFPGRAAYALPPLANLDNGPSGLVFDPGTSMLPEEFRGRFFLAHFNGTPVRSGVKSYQLKPRGATFEITEVKEVVWNTLPTDVAFSPDGYLHFVDWVDGWPKSEKGRLYRLVPAQLDPRAAQTARLLGEGFTQRPVSELVSLLEHADMRVRQEAQFELAARREFASLRDVALRSNHELARLHSIWGLGQIMRAASAPAAAAAPVETLLPLLTDPMLEVRAHAAALMGEIGLAAAQRPLLNLFADASDRVRFHAIMAYAKLYSRPGAAPASPLEALRSAADAASVDPFLRHAISMLLAAYQQGTPQANMVQQFATPQANVAPSPTRRMSTLLALRRLKDARIATFLSDPDPLIVVEAARAINDVPISGAMPALAAMLNLQGRITALNSAAPSVAMFGNADYPQSSLTNRQFQIPPRATGPGNVAPARPDYYGLLVIRPLWRRVLNANFVLGQPETAAALALFAANTPDTAVSSAVASECRAEVLLMLSQWGAPAPRDKVVGLWRPLATRPPTPAVAAIEPQLRSLLLTSPAEVRMAAAKTAADLGATSAAPTLAEVVNDGQAPFGVRAQALQALDRLKAPQFLAALKQASTDADANLRREATRLLASTNVASAGPQLELVLRQGSIPEKQAAYAALAIVPGSVVDEIILNDLGGIRDAARIPRELQLDLLEAAAARGDDRIRRRLDDYRASLPANDTLAELRPALYGGNAESGRKILLERADTSCTRCHRINGQGADIGPDLSHVAATRDREYLLKSVAFPNADIATGFENTTVSMRNGNAHVGVLKSENEREVVLSTVGEGVLTLMKTDITARQKGLSGMPEGLDKMLNRQELRDLVEFLASLK